MVIFCFQNIEKNSNAIKSISRSGTTFTAIRLGGETFTFTQQDNNTTYANYKGATTAASGTAGLVPAATTANRLKFLRGDATWQVPTNTTYAAATTSADGLMTAADKIKLDNSTQHIIAAQTRATDHTETSAALQFSNTELAHMNSNFIGWNGQGQLYIKKSGAYLVYIRVTLKTYTSANAGLIIGLHMSTDHGVNFSTAMYQLYLSNYNPTYTATVMFDTGINNPYNLHGQEPSPVRVRFEIEDIINVTCYTVFMKFYYMGDVFE